MISVAKGRYIVAVSGGVDSMALLDMLRRQQGLELVVAHVNHGIRADSGEDQKLVATFCMSHNITFVSKELHLKPHVSEAGARAARYSYLRQCRDNFNAKAIITAHHQDDVLETALINIMRGTGWRGIAPFVGSSDILRPLLDTTKNELKTYAQEHNVPWREDSTNKDQRYLRNYIRQTVRPMLDIQNPHWPQLLMRQIRSQQLLRRKIDDELRRQIKTHISTTNNVISERYFWIMLPLDVSYEIFQQLCRQTLGHSLVSELAQAALLFAKTAKPGKSMELNNMWQLRTTRNQLIVEPRASMIS